MPLIRSYVVRIYRSSHAGVVGVIEDVKTGRSHPFGSISELWDALRSPGAGTSRRSDPPQPPLGTPSDASAE